MNSMWILCLTCLLAGPQDKPKAATLEDSISTALRNHPDIRIAQAKLQMAEAELAQARLVITQKITAAHADLTLAKAQQTIAERNHQRMIELQKRSAISAEEYEDARLRLEHARAAVAAKEASLNVLLGGPIQAAAPDFKQNSLTEAHPTLTANLVGAYLAASSDKGSPINEAALRYLAAYAGARTAPQPIADRLKAVLDKPVTMEKQQDADLGTFLNELLKRAAPDIKVRLPATENKQLYTNVTKLSLDAGEYSFRGWLEIALDEANNFHASPNRNSKPLRYDFYLREYGLLLSTPDLAPPDAITVQQYWKQLQAERASKEAERPAKEKGEKK